MVQVTTDAGEIIVTYRHDGLNRRIAKLFGADPVQPTFREDHYYNERWQLLEVRRDGDADPYEQIVWDIRYIDSPICRFRDGDLDGAYDKTAAGVDDNLYFANDGNFNVTALVSPSSGLPVERFVYTPYGQPTIYTADWSATVAWASSRKNQVLFCGYRHDPETGLYHVRNRMLTPTLGRWTVRDCNGHVDGMSLYQYARTSPVTFVDWNGNAAQSTSGPASQAPPPSTPQPPTAPASQPALASYTDKLFMRQLAPKPYDCGAFEWQLGFALRDAALYGSTDATTFLKAPHKTRGTWILQRATLSVQMFDKNNAVLAPEPEFRKRGETSYADLLKFGPTFTEGWWVDNKGLIRPSIWDTWSLKVKLTETKGTISIRANITVLHDYILPSTFGTANVKITNGLYGMYGTPPGLQGQFRADKPPLEHAIEVSWDCCLGVHRTKIGKHAP